MRDRTAGVPLRTAVIAGTAFLCGAAAGTVATEIATTLGYSQPGIGQLTAGFIALWVAEKLDRLISDSVST